MEILKTAMAGTLESSDAQVTVEPGDNGIELIDREQRDPSVWETDPRGGPGDLRTAGCEKRQGDNL